MIALDLALAVVIGVSLGLLGSGGSILTVPVFVYLLGYDAKVAVAASLFVVGTASLAGALGHVRQGNLDLLMALTFGPFAMLGAYLGADLARIFSGAAQLVLFAVLMLVAAFFMLRDATEGGRLGYEGPAGTLWSPFMLAKIGAQGLAVGVLTGLVGVGGGFLIIPALVLVCGVDMKRAVGTSLLIIFLNSGSGLLGYVGQVSLPWGFLALFTTFSVFGILIGARLSRYVSQDTLKEYFALLLIVIAAFVLVQNTSPFS
ncbi:sulfite exporter TauE/SafE family protein [Rubrobacter indicoceani]|uniref:sulfite exporter TauE/SafE family protein n=1 Tax=Rubrobacter indicoceani TaxID=2051957 RepID=UPI000E5C126A|nr:sulfite exporter TauE/SafE family protein [Rubrobacter indicoceani]